MHNLPVLWTGKEQQNMFDLQNRTHPFSINLRAPKPDFSLELGFFKLIASTLPELKQTCPHKQDEVKIIDYPKCVNPNIYPDSTKDAYTKICAQAHELFKDWIIERILDDQGRCSGIKLVNPNKDNIPKSWLCEA